MKEQDMTQLDAQPTPTVPSSYSIHISRSSYPQEATDSQRDSALISIPNINNTSTALTNNKTLILRIIKDAGAISRKDLAYHSGLTPASITSITKDLIQSGLVTESGIVEGNHGRRMSGLSLRTDRFCTIAGRITSKYYAFGIYDINSKCIEVKKQYIETFQNVSRTVQEISAAIRTNLARARELKLEPIGIAIGVTGNFRLSSNACFMMGEDGVIIDIQKYLEREFTLPLLFGNSSIYTAYRFLCRRDLNFLANESVALVSLSFSIDTTIIRNRQIHTGAVNVPGLAGKQLIIDPYTGQPSSLEDCISTQAMLNRAAREAEQNPESVLHGIEHLRSRDVFNAFNDFDPVAVSVIKYIADVLGVYLAELTLLLLPDRIILNDEIPISAEFAQMVRQAFARHLPVSLGYLPVIGGDKLAERTTSIDPSIIGGSMFLTNKLLQSPKWLAHLKENG